MSNDPDYKIRLKELSSVTGKHRNHPELRQQSDNISSTNHNDTLDHRPLWYVML